jgi:hypothetical protein
MREAVQLVQDGVSIRKAARIKDSVIQLCSDMCVRGKCMMSKWEN